MNPMPTIQNVVKLRGPEKSPISLGEKYCREWDTQQCCTLFRVPLPLNSRS